MSKNSKAWKGVAVIFALAAALAVCVILLRPAAAASETIVPVYGRGPVEIRIYTDYFCSPCQALETELDNILPRIVKAGKGRVMSIDTPVHRQTKQYAKYYYYASCGVDFKQAWKARAVLFEAARMYITDDGAIARHLEAKGCNVRERNTGPYFRTLSEYIKRDNIKSTPTCIIESNGQKRVYEGRAKIIRALNGILN